MCLYIVTNYVLLLPWFYTLSNFGFLFLHIHMVKSFWVIIAGWRIWVHWWMCSSLQSTHFQYGEKKMGQFLRLNQRGKYCKKMFMTKEFHFIYKRNRHIWSKKIIILHVKEGQLSVLFSKRRSRYDPQEVGQRVSPTLLWQLQPLKPHRKEELMGPYGPIAFIKTPKPFLFVWA